MAFWNNIEALNAQLGLRAPWAPPSPAAIGLRPLAVAAVECDARRGARGGDNLAAVECDARRGARGGDNLAPPRIKRARMDAEVGGGVDATMVACAAGGAGAGAGAAFRTPVLVVRGGEPSFRPSKAVRVTLWLPGSVCASAASSGEAVGHVAGGGGAAVPGAALVLDGVDPRGRTFEACLERARAEVHAGARVLRFLPAWPGVNWSLARLGAHGTVASVSVEPAACPAQAAYPEHVSAERV